MYIIRWQKPSHMFRVLDIDVTLADVTSNTTHTYLHLLTSMGGDGELPNQCGKAKKPVIKN